MYPDRLVAGQVLAGKLEKYKNDPVILLAIPRGGIPVAYAIAEELGFPVDLVLTKKIGHPSHKEYAIGAVSLTDSFIVPHEGVTEHYIKKETARIRTQLQQQYVKFMGHKKPVKAEGKTVIIIDDGVATGNTLIATVDMLKKENPGRLVIAVPVAATSAVIKLSGVVDEVICPLVAEKFIGVGGFYEDFTQVTDEEAIAYLDKLRREKIIQ